MDGRERVIRTITFDNPDRIPVDAWVLPAARLRHGEQLDELLARYETDIAFVNGPFDIGFDPRHYQIGEFVDVWGTKWKNIQAGLVGEVKEPLFEQLSSVYDYPSPIPLFQQMWRHNRPQVENDVKTARDAGKFVIGGWISVFERMQFLRGTENLYCDLAMGEYDLQELFGLIERFYEAYVDQWLALDIDAMVFGDDWGSQRSLLIGKDMWKTFFKPVYTRLISRIRAAGKYVFFHSDGTILDLYDQFIELGVSAINSQLWCMGIETVASRFAGKITFWGEISRQTTLPNGSPADIARCKEELIRLFHKNGGLIGQSEFNRDVPLDNAQEVLKPWKTI